MLQKRGAEEGRFSRFPTGQELAHLLHCEPVYAIVNPILDNGKPKRKLGTQSYGPKGEFLWSPDHRK